jgi:hypothetical protein
MYAARTCLTTMLAHLRVRGRGHSPRGSGVAEERGEVCRDLGELLHRRADGQVHEMGRGEVDDLLLELRE